MYSAQCFADSSVWSYSGCHGLSEVPNLYRLRSPVLGMKLFVAPAI